MPQQTGCYMVRDVAGFFVERLSQNQNRIFDRKFIFNTNGSIVQCTIKLINNVEKE